MEMRTGYCKLEEKCSCYIVANILVTFFSNVLRKIAVINDTIGCLPDAIFKQSVESMAWVLLKAIQ